MGFYSDISNGHKISVEWGNAVEDAVIPKNPNYFIRAYKDGSPNVFGTTDDDLTGS